MNKIKLAVVDDHRQFRQAIIRLLNLEDDFTVVIDAFDGIDLLQKLETIKVDIILMDIRMPEMDGITTTLKIQELFPGQKIIIYSLLDFEANVIKMYSLGVKCFVSKSCKSEELFKAIRIVSNGGTYVTEDFSAIVKNGLFKKESPLNYNQFNLSDKENQMLRMIIEGHTSKSIGDRLSKSHRTIEEYREKLYCKLGVKNKAELMAMIYSKV